MKLEFLPDPKDVLVSSGRHKFFNQIRNYQYQTAKEETPQAVFEFEGKARREREVAQSHIRRR